MKKIFVLCILLSCFIYISACSRPADTNNVISLKDTSTAENVSSNLSADAETPTANYQNYNGDWSSNGQSHKDIIKNGGTGFHVEIINDDELHGYLYSQQGTSERFAEIDDIIGKITDGKCSYSFSDDGWDNSGTLFIQLKEGEINIEVKDFILSSQNTSGFGISGSYKLIPMNDSMVTSETESVSEEIDLQEAALQKYSTDWPESQILKELEKRKPYTDSCSFYPEFLQYMENVREIRDISMYLEPLYSTDTEYYQASDFDNVPQLIIYLAKNEIYARYGYTFKDTDLNSYFLSQLWYLPEFDSDNFDASVFNEYEMANLQLLAQLDTYK